MKAVILAAGQSSRFYPFSVLPHKSFFPLMGKPIIDYTLQSIQKTGIREVIIVVSPHSPIPDLLGNGKQWDLSITYVTQKSPDGQGDGLLSAKKYIDGEFFLLNAYRFDFNDFYKIMIGAKQEENDIVLLGKRENVLGKFGVAKVTGTKVMDIIEKPTSINPETDIRVMGIYLLNPSFLRILEKAPRDHYNLELALTTFARENTARIAVVQQSIFSLKYPWDLFELKKYLFKDMTRNISTTATIAVSAQILGDVTIGDNAVIMENTVIKGPCYIGDGALVGNNAVVRDYSVIEKDCKIGMNAEIKNTIMGEKSSIHSGSLEDSIIGTDVKIGAFFCSSNVRIDRKNVIVTVKNVDVDSGIKSLGVCIGDSVKIGARVTTMPGILIGSNVIVGPSTTVMKNIKDNSKYYTKFQEIVAKTNE